jgi:hypothetical protein
MAIIEKRRKSICNDALFNLNPSPLNFIVCKSVLF